MPAGRKIALWALVPVGVLTAALAGGFLYFDLQHDPSISFSGVVDTIISAFGWVVVILLVTILPVAVPVAIAVVVLRWMGVIGPGPLWGGKSAREMLDERLARGEIDQSEYERCRLAISSQ